MVEISRCSSGLILQYLSFLITLYQAIYIIGLEIKLNGTGASLSHNKYRNICLKNNGITNLMSRALLMVVLL